MPRGAVTRWLTYAAGVLCWSTAGILGLLLIGGAIEDSLSAAQAVVMLAATVGLGWVGWRALGYVEP